MTRTAADTLVEELMDWGVEVVFGLPGDGINGLMESLRTHREHIRFIQVRHEESAAFAATAYAKFTGRLGVCLATSGPGGLHLTNGLYDAKLDGAPVLAITGHHYSDLIDTKGQQDVDLTRVFEDVAVYNTRVMNAAHVANVVPLACRTALANRGVAHICFPTDLQEQPADAGPRARRDRPGHAGDVFRPARTAAREDEIARAAALLNAGRRTTILAGAGALAARDALESVADRLGAPVVTALLGKGAVPDDSPFATGPIGLLGTKPSEEAMRGCEALLIVGSSFPYIEFYPKPGDARGVQVDLDPTRIGLRYPVEVGLVGDARLTLERLLPLLDRQEDRAFLDGAQKGMAEWRETMAERAGRDDKPMKPQRVAAAVDAALTDDAIVVSDSGTITTWFARHIRAVGGRRFGLSGNLATMACGLPYAIGAQIAHPDRQVVAFVGDGGLSMLMADLATAVKYHLPIRVVVIKNDYLAQIKWEQMVFLGNPEYGVELQPIDFAKVAEACGAAAVTIDEPRSCGPEIEAAFRTEGPVLIQAVVDPLELPMPASISVDQARKFAIALARGEPRGGEIMANAITTRVREMV
jgi:pyruvate dehydrogenase (quinone)